MGRIWSTLTPRVKRRLGLAAAASVAVPLLAGEFAKTFVQVGLSNAPLRDAQFIDIVVIGVISFALVMVFTVMLGCLITGVMKGPAWHADAYPLPPSHD
ncbi:hypothetical protein [Piscinibacter sp.]|uniref:hypothetical protein n=1 Tax=Piscinibacter sp. TaxID=1903157 RepID=UPI00355A4FE4